MESLNDQQQHDSTKNKAKEIIDCQFMYEQVLKAE